jgi:transposase-like protein
MEDYPRTILELEDRFLTEEACREYLMRLRWPTGFVCPRCQTEGGWPATRGRVVCRACRYQASVTAGTVFQDTHKPLRLWFRAIWHVVSQKSGASAVNVQQILGLGSYRTAWTWLHKLRRAMVRPGRDRLHGRIEVDETQVGGEKTDADGHRSGRKMLVVIAAEEDGRGIGRIRMARIPDKSKATLHAFVQRVVELGSVVHTDGLMAYRGLETMGYEHEATALLGQEKDAALWLLPRVHRVASQNTTSSWAVVNTLPGLSGSPAIAPDRPPDGLRLLGRPRPSLGPPGREGPQRDRAVGSTATVRPT